MFFWRASTSKFRFESSMQCVFINVKQKSHTATSQCGNGKLARLPKHLVSMSWRHLAQTLGKEGSSWHVKNLVKSRESGDLWSSLFRSHAVRNRKTGICELRMYRVFISGRLVLHLYIHISIYNRNGNDQNMGSKRCLNTLSGLQTNYSVNLNPSAMCAWECAAPLSLLGSLSPLPLNPCLFPSGANKSPWSWELGLGVSCANFSLFKNFTTP